MFLSKQTRTRNFEFTHDSFSDVTPTWSKVLNSYKNKENLNYLEIGMFEGRSMIWMFDNILTAGSCRATGIDVFYEAPRERIENNLKLAGIREKVNIIQGNSRIVMKTMDPEQFDIIYVDADHRARGALADLVLAWDLLK